MRRAVLTIFAAVSMTSLAFAGEGPWYVGASYNTVKSDWGSRNFDLTALGLQAGYQLTDVVAMEVRTGTGNDDTDSGLKVELDSYYGIYCKVGIPSNSVIYPYALLGYTNVDVTFSGAGRSRSDKSDDISYGAGVSFNINNLFDVNIEYVKMFDNYNITYDSASIGASYRF